MDSNEIFSQDEWRQVCETSAALQELIYAGSLKAHVVAASVVMFFLAMDNAHFDGDLHSYLESVREAKKVAAERAACEQKAVAQMMLDALLSARNKDETKTP